MTLTTNQTTLVEMTWKNVLSLLRIKKFLKELM
jgi:hypothetical protein